MLRTARSHSRDPQVQLMIADELVVLKRRPAALRRYAQVTSMASDAGTRASALLSGAHTRANVASYDAALRELKGAQKLAGEVHGRRARDNLLAWIMALQARIYAVTDDEDASLRLYRQVATLAGRTRNLDLRTTALLFGSDLLRSRGRYPQALGMLARVFEDNEMYGRPYTRVWGRFYRGETLCAVGQVRDGLADLETCRATARASANHQGAAWASLALASYHRSSDLDAAAADLDNCEASIAAYGRGMLLCDARLEWERAELARACGQIHEALQRIAILRRRLSSPSFPARLPYMTPHMLALEGEVARSQGDHKARALLTEARSLYAQGRWNHCAARIDVSLWLMTNKPDPPSRLLQRCRKYRYAAEVERLTNRKADYFPLHGL